MMSYIDLNWDFSQFDRDNSARHHAAGYAKIANAIAPYPGDPGGKITSADTPPRLAQMAFAAHDYGDALGRGAARVRGRRRGRRARRRPVDDRRAEHVDDRRAGEERERPGSQGEEGRLAKDLDEKANIKRMFGRSKPRDRSARRGPRRGPRLSLRR